MQDLGAARRSRLHRHPWSRPIVHGRQRALPEGGGNPRYFPTRACLRNRPGPWKASEEDMWLREQQELRKDEMNQVRMAAAVAAGTVPGLADVTILVSAHAKSLST